MASSPVSVETEFLMIPLRVPKVKIRPPLVGSLQTTSSKERPLTYCRNTHTP